MSNGHDEIVIRQLEKEFRKQIHHKFAEFVRLHDETIIAIAVCRLVTGTGWWHYPNDSAMDNEAWSSYIAEYYPQKLEFGINELLPRAFNSLLDDVIIAMKIQIEHKDDATMVLFPRFQKYLQELSLAEFVRTPLYSGTELNKKLGNIFNAKKELPRELFCRLLPVVKIDCSVEAVYYFQEDGSPSEEECHRYSWWDEENQDLTL